MSELQIMRIDEIDPYSGSHAREGIRFRPVGGALGVSAWGMNVLEIEPGASTYPEHDHAEDGQEEVFFVLEGDATLRTGDGERRVEAGTFVRVPPGTTRFWQPGERGVTLLALGATPGKAYEPRS